MKAFLPICCLLLSLVAQPLPAQIVDHSLSFGFVTIQQVVKPLGNDRWLVVGIGIPYQGAWFYDTLFAVILDREGQILLQKALIPPDAETYEIADVLPLPDGGFLVSVELGGCDVGVGYSGVVQKYSPDGQLVWTLQGSNDDGNKPPPVWKISPDSNLLGLYYNKMWKVEATTGAVLWQAVLVTPNNSKLPSYFDLLPGTEDILGIGSPEYFPDLSPPDFQIWNKMSDANGIHYMPGNLLELASSRQGLGFASNGWYYAINDSIYTLERVNAVLEREVLPLSIDLAGFVQMTATDSGLYWLGRYYGQNWLYKTDFLGQNPVELPMPDYWLSGHSVAAQGNAVAVAGTDGSGPKSMPGQPSYQEFQALHLWTRTFSDLSSMPSADTMNAGVTGLQQLSGVDTMSFLGGGWSHYFSLHGGNFQVQITNRGNTVLNRVYINFSYEQFQGFICYSTAAVRQLHTDLQLAPGASTWLSFGDLAVEAQSGLASEFCFWTSAPNERPDAHHEDDHFCIPAAYTVATDAPFGQSVKLLPNPAQDYFRVLNAADSGEAEWQLHDATGRLVHRGLYPAGQSELSISTEQLPNGFYIFRMNGHVGKLIVKH